MSLVCGGIAAFFTVWIIAPAPLAILWLAGIAGTEWSLWWGLLGIIGAVIGFQVRRAGGKASGTMGIVLGAFAATASLLPVLESIPAARQQSVTLSLTRFFFGEKAARTPAALPETVSFATVGRQRLLLDIYQASPSQNTIPGPAVIVVHGGSWSGGKKSDFAHWDRWLTTQGYTIFDIQYRIAPQPNWREATGDVKTAVAWVKRHAAQYRIDPDRIALFGRSAGGHLALLTAYTPGDTKLPASGPDSQVDTRVRAVVSLYGPTDLIWGYYHPAKPDVINGPGTLRRFLGGDPGSLPADYAEASPITHVGPDTPPTLLIHGERDLLVVPQHTQRLSERLSAAHVPYQSVYIPYALHGFDFNINGWGSQIEQPVLLEFLHKYLAPLSRKK